MSPKEYIFNYVLSKHMYLNTLDLKAKHFNKMKMFYIDISLQLLTYLMNIQKPHKMLSHFTL